MLTPSGYPKHLIQALPTPPPAPASAAASSAAAPLPIPVPRVEISDRFDSINERLHFIEHECPRIMSLWERARISEHPWIVQLLNECEKIHELATQMIVTGSEGEHLYASPRALQRISHTLNEFLQAIPSDSPLATRAQQLVQRSLEEIESVRQWTKVQRPLEQLSEENEEQLARWHEEWDEPYAGGAEIPFGHALSNYKQLIGQSAAIMKFAKQKAAQLNTRLKLQLFHELHAQLKLISEAQRESGFVEALHTSFAEAAHDLSVAKRALEAPHSNGESLMEDYRRYLLALSTWKESQSALNTLKELHALLMEIEVPQAPPEVPQTTGWGWIRTLDTTLNTLFGVFSRSTAQSLNYDLNEELRTEREGLLTQFQTITAAVGTEIRAAEKVLAADETARDELTAQAALLGLDGAQLGQLFLSPLERHQGAALPDEEMIKILRELIPLFSWREPPAYAAALSTARHKAIQFITAWKPVPAGKTFEEHIQGILQAEEQRLQQLAETAWHERKTALNATSEQESSPTRVRALNLFFLALHAGTWIRDASALRDSGIRVTAAYQREFNLDRVTAEQGFIGTVLSDKFQALRAMDEQRLQKFTKRFPETFDLLNRVRTGEATSLTSKEIQGFMQAHLAARLPAYSTVSNLPPRPPAAPTEGTASAEESPPVEESPAPAPPLSTELIVRPQDLTAASTDQTAAGFFSRLFSWTKEQASRLVRRDPISLTIDHTNNQLNTQRQQIARLEQRAEDLGVAEELAPLLRQATGNIASVAQSLAHLAEAPASADQRSLEMQKHYMHAIDRRIDQIDTSLNQKTRAVLNLMTLLESPAIPLDDSLFQHVMGGHWGKGTRLEGYAASGMLDAFQTMIARQITALQQHPLCTEENQLAFCRSLVNDPSKSNAEILSIYSAIQRQMDTAARLEDTLRSSDLQTFISAYHTQVDALNPGDSFFFYGGWVTERDRSGGHSIIYEVIKQSDGRFTFRIYNRGEGSETFTSAAFSGIQHQLPFTEIVDIAPTQIGAPVILAGLRQLAVESPFAGESPFKAQGWLPADLAALLPAFEGHFSSHLYTRDQMLEAMQVGHCTFLAMEGWMSRHLQQRPLFDRFTVEMQLKITHDYFIENERRLATDEQSRRLLGMGLEQAFRNLHGAGDLFTREERDFMLQELKSIRRGLYHAQSSYDAEVARIKPRFSVAPIPAQRFSLHEWRFDSQAETMAAPPQARPLALAGISEWRYDPATFTQDLDLFHTRFVEARQAGLFHIAKEGLKALLLKIPLATDPRDPAAFIHRLSPDEAQKLILTLGTISREYLYDFLNHIQRTPNQVNTLPVDDFLALIKLFTFADATARHFKETLGFELPSLYQQDFDWILFGRSPNAVVALPAWEEERRLLTHYWKTDREENHGRLDFFGFDRIPAGKEFGNIDGSFVRPRYFLDRAEDRDPLIAAYALNKYDHLDWGDVQFALQWIQRPEVASRIALTYPELASLSLHELAGAALANEMNSKKYTHENRLAILPDAYFSLRDIAFALNYMMTGSQPTDTNSFNLDKGIIFRLKRNMVDCGGREYPLNSIKYVTFGRERNDEDSTKEKVTRAFNRVESPLVVIPERWNELGVDALSVEKRLRNTQEMISDTESPFWALNEYIYDEDNYSTRDEPPHHRLIVESNSGLAGRHSSDRISAQANALVKLSRSEQQELLALATNNFVEDTFAYYVRAPQKLEKLEHRKFFYRQMQRGLEEAFLRGPEVAVQFSETAAAFCKSNFELALQRGKWMEAGYFTMVNNLFERFATLVQQRHPSSFPPGYHLPFHTTEMIHTLLQRPELSDEDRTALWFESARRYNGQDTLSVDAVQTLLTATIHNQIYPMPKEHPLWSMQQGFERENLLMSLREPIVQLMRGTETRNRSLNGVLRTFYPNLSGNRSWKLYHHHPFYGTVDENVIIDVEQGRLTMRGGTAMRLPDEIRNSGCIQRVFGDERRILAADTGRLPGERYEFVDDEGNNYRIIKRKEYSELYRQIDGTWFRYESFLDIPARAFSTNAYMWKSTETITQSLLEGAPTTAWIGQQRSPAITHRLAMQGRAVIEIHVVDEQRRDTDLLLGNIYTQPTSFVGLESIEYPAYTLVWVHKETREPVRIELPRLKLTFDIRSVDGRPQALCREIPGYQIAAHQHLPLLGDMQGYLILERKQRGRVKQLLVIPHVELERTPASRPLYTESVRWSPPQGYFLYDLIKTRHPSNPVALQPRPTGTASGADERFFLASLLLWDRRYEESFSLLRGLGSDLQPLTSEQLSLLKNIRELRTSDHHPQAYAIRLYTIYLELRNQQNMFRELPSDQNKEDEKQVKEIQQLYGTYLLKRHQLGSLRLLPDEERLLATYGYSSNAAGPPQVAVAPLVPRELPYSEGERPKVLLSSLSSESHNEPTGGLLRLKEIRYHVRPFCDRLIQLQMSRESGPQYRAMIRTLSGIEFSENSNIEELKIALKQIFNIISRSTSNPEDRLSAHFLALVLEHPQHPAVNKILTSTNKDDLGLALKELETAAAQSAVATERSAPLVATQPSSRPLLHPVHSPSPNAEYQLALVRNNDALLLTQPLMIDTQSFISTTPPPAAVRQRIETSSQQLQQLLSVTTGDSVTDRSLREAQQQLVRFGDTLVARQTKYRISNYERLAEVKSEFSLQHERLTPLIKQKWRQLSVRANKRPTEPLPHQSMELRVASDDFREIGFLELSGLCRSELREPFRSRNPALAPAEIDQIFNDWKELVAYMIYQQQLESALSQIDLVEEARDRQSPPSEENALVQKLMVLLTSNRQFDANAHPHYLMLERYSSILLRNDQIQDLDRLMVRQPRVHSTQQLGLAQEKKTGSGKTAVFVPLQALGDANGEEFPLITMPAQLLPDASAELQLALGEGFDQVTEMITISRETPMGQVQLQILLDRLQSIIENKKALFMSGRSLQGMFLLFIEKMLIWANPQHPERRVKPIQELALMRQIIDLMRTHAVVTMDEVHDSLDVLKLHQFTLGERAPVRSELIDVGGDLLLYMLTDPDMRRMVALPFDPHPTGAAMTQRRYEEQLRPRLIQMILDGNVVKSQPNLIRFLANLSDEQRGWVGLYLNNETNEQSGQFIRSIESMVIKNGLAVLKEEVSRIFALTALKRCGEDYAPIPHSARNDRPHDRDLAVPHRYGQPSLKAQFGTILEILNYSLQMIFYLGLERPIVQKEVDLIKAAMNRALQKGGRVNRAALKQAQAAWAELSGNSPHNIFLLTSAQMDALVAYVNSQPHLQLALAKRHILAEQLVIYKEMLTATSQTYQAIAKIIKGFSATLWNHESFASLFHQINLSNAQAEALSTLWNNSPHQISVIQSAAPASPANVAAVISDYYSHSQGKKGAFADAAGIFRNVKDNEIVARAIIELPHWPDQQPPIEGIVFYKGDRKMVLLRGHATPILFSQCTLLPHSLIAYWDQAHCTGSNIILGATMTATVTVGGQNMIHEIVQAVGRLRQIDVGQVANFAVQIDDFLAIAEVIESLTGEIVTTDRLQLKHLILYLVYNEALRKGRDNSRGLKQSLQGVLLEKVIAVLSERTVTQEEALRILWEARELFVTETPEDPYHSIGATQRPMTRSEATELQLNNILNSRAMKAFAELPALSSRFPYRTLVEELTAVALQRGALLPDQVQGADDTEQEVEVQVQTHVQAQTETQQQQQQEVQQEMEKETETERNFELSLTARPISQWPTIGLFQRSTFVAAPYYNDRRFPANVAPFMGIKQVMTQFRETSPYADIFDDPDLLATVNLIPYYTQRPQNDDLLFPHYTPFGKYQDHVWHTAVVQDKANGRLLLILGDQEDVLQLKALLNNDRLHPSTEPREMRLALYNLETGISQQSAEPIHTLDNRLENNPAFLRLLVKAKFFAGEVHYSDAELPLLRAWIESKGTARMQQFFTSVIIRQKTRQRQDYPQSAIKNLFGELLQLPP